MCAKPAGPGVENLRVTDDSAERGLAIVLRLGGSVLLLAFGAALLPTSWMTATHGWLAMGQFPSSPLVDYLTRSIALLYGIKGGLYWVLATDVRRNAVVIRYVAWTTTAFGLLVLFVDFRAGLPLFWRLGEGPSVASMGIVLLWLLRRVRPVDPQ
jgi:hypothetical protein